MRSAFLFFGFFALISGLRAEPTTVAKAVAPAWVADYPVDLLAKEPAEGIRDGTWGLLVDDQTNGAEVTHFEHYARKFTTQNAIREMSRIQVKFNPAYETLTWHRLQIYRDGQVIERLPLQNIRVLSREQNLDENLYDGTVTAVIELEDLQVGDVVEYSYSVQGENPIFAGKYSSFINTTWGTPVHQLRIRLLWPTERPIFYKEKLSRLQSFNEEKTGALRDLRWSADDLPVLIPDAETPGWAMPLGWLQLTEYSSWAEVVQWALAHYQVNDPLPDKLKPVMEKIRLLPTEDAQILAALEYVQDQIRYLSISEGVHSHEPYTVEQVIQRGFGDCKDKARLLSTILSSLGFDAAPALVQTMFRQSIADWLPTPEAFDHVVVRLTWKGTIYWLDATVSHQRGNLNQRFFPAFGKALVIAKDTTALTTIEPSGFDTSSINCAERYVISAYNAEVKLTVLLTYRGDEADSVRVTLANESPEEVEKSMLNFRARLYPGIRAEGKPEIHDDPQRNEIIIEGKYTIQDFWQGRPDDAVLAYADFYASSLAADLAAPSEPRRTAPLAVNHPRRLEQITTIQFPDASQLAPESKIINDPAFNFTYDVSQVGPVLTIRQKYRSLSNNVAPAALENYLGHLKDARGRLEYSLHIPKAQTLPTMVAPIPSSSTTRFNGVLGSFALAALVFSIGGCIALYFWRPVYDPFHQFYEPRLQGLSGWLVLVGIALILRPLTLILTLIGLLFMDRGVWAEFTTPRQVLSFFEAMIVAFILVFDLLLIVLFFQKRRTFPTLMIVLLSIMPVLGISNLFLGFQGVMQALIWIPYFCKSRRVATTFVRGGRRIKSGRAAEEETFAHSIPPPLPRSTPPPLPQAVLAPMKKRRRRAFTPLALGSYATCIACVPVLFITLLTAGLAPKTEAPGTSVFAGLLVAMLLALGGVALVVLAVRKTRGWGRGLTFSLIGNAGMALLILLLFFGAATDFRRKSQQLPSSTNSASTD